MYKKTENGSIFSALRVWTGRGPSYIINQVYQLIYRFLLKWEEKLEETGGCKMAEKKCAVPFQGTAEQEAELMAVISELKDEPGALMPIMQRAQDIYGYLPIEVQTMISDATGHPLEEIYGISTFYSMFNLNPKGKYQVSVCLGTACYVKGSGAIYDKLKELLEIDGGECTADGKFSLDACRCVGACGLAPVMMINDEVFGRLTADEVEDILQKFE